VDELVARHVGASRLEAHALPDCDALWDVRVGPGDEAGARPARPFARVFVTTACQSDGTGCIDMFDWTGTGLEAVPHYCL